MSEKWIILVNDKAAEPRFELLGLGGWWNLLE